MTEEKIQDLIKECQAEAAKIKLRAIELLTKVYGMQKPSGTTTVVTINMSLDSPQPEVVTRYHALFL